MSEKFLLIPIVISIIFGIMFLLAELYHENYCFECKGPRSKELQTSLIAGFSIGYFFLKLLPEIFTALSLYNQGILTFVSMFIGFCLIHLSEKIILKRVGNRSRTIIKDIVIKKTQLEIEGKVTEKRLTKELQKGEWDKLTLTSLASSLVNIIEQESNIKRREKEVEEELETKLNKDLEIVHVVLNYVYHLIIGLIIISLLITNLVSGILFSSFAFLKATISNTSNRHVKILDISIHAKMTGQNFVKYFSITSVLVGIFLGLILELLNPIPLYITFQSFAFASGIILYIIVREVIPEQEKGNPNYFLLGTTIFVLILILVENVF
jgi:zinc transporter ZupT